MKIKKWDEYGQILKDIMTTEVIIILSFFGSSHKFLQEVQKQWFAQRDIKQFKKFLDKLFETNSFFESETERDEITFSLRLSAICDVFANFEFTYKKATQIAKKSNNLEGGQLGLIAFTFNTFFKNVAQALLSEKKLINVPGKYLNIVNPISKVVEEIIKSEKFEDKLNQMYLINEMISDLLELLEEDPENTGKFSSDSEVMLYNFAICYSTTLYFSLLLYEKITEVEEHEGNVKRFIDKPITEENEARAAEAQMTGSNGEELFYNTLKN